MKKIKEILVVVGVYAAFCSGQQTPSRPLFGSVEGIVLSADGVPVPHAKVYTETIEKPTFGKRYYSFTDVSGRFFLDRVYVGQTALFAVKEEDGYPDTGLAVFGPSLADLPRIVVDEGTTTRHVVVRLGQKGGTITGSIVDNITGKPVVNSRIHLYRTSDPSRDLTTGPDEDGRFNFVVPSLPFKFEVWAPGYEKWQYQKGSAGSSANILLNSAGRLKIEVTLIKAGFAKR